jgi:hypothetical protein
MDYHRSETTSGGVSFIGMGTKTMMSCSVTTERLNNTKIGPSRELILIRSDADLVFQLTVVLILL